MTVTDAASRLNAALSDRYRIERELGAGGMATVYLARDLRHERNVALKVLRPELSAVVGAERFLKEIRVTANLQHPHILALHDSGEADGLVFYVMPFVEGESLRDRLNRDKQLPVDDAVRIAREVLSALDYAHRRGVVHRDIKPENILLHEGQALVADFGIALAMSAAGAGTRMTETGMSLGTPHYMSPEQAMGEREISPRSDVYALGCVLYEMLLGEPPFTGPTAQSIIARVITETPRGLTAQRKTIPPNVEAAVHVALQKLPADRFASAADFADALTRQGFATAASGVYAPPGTSSAVHLAVRDQLRQPVARAALALVAIAIVVGAFGWFRPPAPRPVSRFSLALPDSQQLFPGAAGTRLAVSPDGSRFVYVGPGDAGGMLWVRERDQLLAKPIPGTDDAVNPFFSPDGERIGFATVKQLRLKTVSFRGEPPLIVGDSTVDWDGASWGRDGYIYFDGIRPRGLMRVRAGGGPVEAVTLLDSARHETEHSYPDVLPNGKGLIFVIWHGATSADHEIAALDLRTHERRTLLKGVYARYAGGYLVYVTSVGTLLAVPFDENRLALTGTPVALAEGVSTHISADYTDLALSASGTLLYLSGPSITVQSELAWVDRSGKADVIDSGAFNTVALSPDGKRIVVSILARDEQLWTRTLPAGPLSKLTFDGQQNYRPAWSADGGTVSMISSRGRGNELFVQRTDGSAPAQLLRGRAEEPNEAEWSPDGRWIVYREGSVPKTRLVATRVTGDTTPVILVATKFSQRAATISPDNKWMAYVSDESGRDEVYVRPFPDADRSKYQISPKGGTEPRWAHSGRELFYRNAKGEMVVCDIATVPSFVSSSEHTLFQASTYASDVNHHAYDVAPDDRRFLMVRPRAENVRTNLIIVDNFIADVRSKFGRNQ